MEASTSSGARFSPRKSSSSKKYCCVYGCNSNPRNSPDVSFHRFPRPKSVFARVQNYFGEFERVDCRKMWERRLKIGNKTCITKNMVVCSLHFTMSDYILPGQSRSKRHLKKNAIPSCNLPNAVTNYKRQEKIKKNNSRKERYLKRKEGKIQDNLETKNLIVIESTMNKDNVNDNKSELDESILHVQNDFVPSEKKSVDVGTQMTLNVDYFDTINSDSELNTLTGIANFEMLNILIEIIEASYPVYKSKTMNLPSEIVMTFMKLKHNLSYTILKALFKYYSISQCRKVILGMIDKLYFCLKDTIYFPSKEEISKNIPSFAEFADVRIVLDCTEINIQRPKKLCCQKTTYSRYKKDFTIKFMTAVDPSGKISFISNAYGGKISENAIFQQSNILDLLEKGDVIMVDKDFKVEKLCKEKDIKLIRSPFKARVHIERFTQRLKVFKVLGSKMPSGFVVHADKIMTVISAIVNMSSPILD